MTCPYRATEKSRVMLTFTPRAVSSSIAGDPGRGGRDLDHHVGPRETTPKIESLLDGGLRVVGEVGRALERHEPVAPTAGLVDGTQQVGGAAHVLERDHEEPLLRGPAPCGAKLVVAKAIDHLDGLGDDELRAVGGRSSQERFFAIALEDVGRAADLLRPVLRGRRWARRLMSLECTPTSPTTAGHHRAGARSLASPRPAQRDDQGAGDRAGIPAIEELTAHGVNVNITLLFSVARYEQVIDAYVAGLERRVAPASPSMPASVASFFVSRVDSKVDALLPAGSSSAAAQRSPSPACLRPLPRPLRRRTLERAARGRRASQRPLWATTGTEDPAYSDVVYVEQLIAPDVINTMLRHPARLRRPWPGDAHAR